MMKKILFAFLFVLTATTAAFSATSASLISDINTGLSRYTTNVSSKTNTKITQFVSESLKHDSDVKYSRTSYYSDPQSRIEYLIYLDFPNLTQSNYVTECDNINRVVCPNAQTDGCVINNFHASGSGVGCVMNILRSPAETPRSADVSNVGVHEITPCDVNNCDTPPQYQTREYKSIKGTIYSSDPRAGNVQNFPYRVRVAYKSDNGIHSYTSIVQPTFGFVIPAGDAGRGTVTFTVIEQPHDAEYEMLTYKTEQFDSENGNSIVMKKKTATTPTRDTAPAASTGSTATTATDSGTPAQTPSAKTMQFNATLVYQDASGNYIPISGATVTDTSKPTTTATTGPDGKFTIECILTRNSRCNLKFEANGQPDYRTSVSSIDIGKRIPYTGYQITDTRNSINTITGIIYEGDTGQPAIQASITPQGRNGTRLKTDHDITNENGEFTITNFPRNTNAEVRYMGYKTKIIPASDLKQGMEIRLDLDTDTLDASVVSAVPCGENEKRQFNATAVKVFNDEKCIPSDCKSGYTLENGETANAFCKPCSKDDVPFARDVTVKNNQCVARNCLDGFREQNGACVVDCNSSRAKNHLNATAAAPKTNAPAIPANATAQDLNYSDYCYPTACDEQKYTLVGSGQTAQCQSKNGLDCTSYIKDATSAKFNDNGVCELYTCGGTFAPNKYTVLQTQKCTATGHDNDKCNGYCENQIGKPCKGDIQKLTDDPQAKAGEITGYADGAITSCKTTECKDSKNWRVENGKCVQVAGTPCDEKDISNIAHAISGTKEPLKNGTIVCKPTCWENYKAKLNGNTYECIFDSKECPSRISSQYPMASTLEITADKEGYWDKNGKIVKCDIKECKDRQQTPSEDRQSCVAKCTEEAANALKTNGHALNTTTDRNGNCIISDCQCGYTLNKGANKCQKWETEVQVPSCTKRTNPVLPENAKTAHMACDTTAPAAEQTYCSIDECDPLFERQADGNRQNAKCVAKSTDCTPDPTTNTTGKGILVEKSGVAVCQPICIGSNYEPDWDAQNKKYNGCVIKRDREGKRCPGDVLRKYPHASRGEVQAQDANGNVTECKITDCDRGYNLDDKNNQCVYCACGTEWDATSKSCKTWADLDKTSCDPMPTGAKTALRTCKDKSSNTDKTDCGDGTCTEYCKITACDTDAGYTLDEAKNECISGIGKPCTSDQLTAVDANATAGVLRKKGDKVVCVITECTGLYTPASDGSSCRPKPMLTEQQHREKIGELSENAQKMRENETSLKNRIIGAAGIGMTGIGGAMVGDALSSRAAELSAEQDMAAYLQSMYCEYGDGKTIRGGETGVELPGGNDMIDLYTQYAQLANDLKIRKDALGIRPGIESEVVIDKAETGLYDDVGTGITGGTYASIARALLYPDGPDAAKWAQMRAATDAKLKAGAIVAGVGAVGSGVANYIVNHDVKNNADEIVNRFTKKPHPITAVQNLENGVNQVTPPTPKCPSDVTTGTFPNCTCIDDNSTFNVEKMTCETCPDSNQTVVDNICVCPRNMPWNESKKACIEKETLNEPQCTPTPGDHLTVNSDGKCDCMDGFSLEESICVCRSPKVEQTQSDGKVLCVDATKPQEQQTPLPTIPSVTTVTDTVNISANALFDLDKATIRSDASSVLDKFVTDLTSDKTLSNCTIDLVGYTDPLGSNSHNLDLSQRRSAAVKTYLTSRGIAKALKNQDTSSITTSGQGEANCKCYADKLIEACKSKTAGTALSGNDTYSPCRRVELTITCQKTTTISQTINDANQVIQAAQTLAGVSQQ